MPKKNINLLDFAIVNSWVSSLGSLGTFLLNLNGGKWPKKAKYKLMLDKLFLSFIKDALAASMTVKFKRKPTIAIAQSYKTKSTLLLFAKYWMDKATLFRNFAEIDFIAMLSF